MRHITHTSEGEPTHVVLFDVIKDNTQLVLLQSRLDKCYTMSLYKYGKLIGEATTEDPDLGKLMCQLVAPIPIDPAFIKLN
jgi:hypothetical protein